MSHKLASMTELMIRRAKTKLLLVLDAGHPIANVQREPLGMTPYHHYSSMADNY